MEFFFNANTGRVEPVNQSRGIINTGTVFDQNQQFFNDLAQGNVVGNRMPLIPNTDVMYGSIVPNNQIVQDDITQTILPMKKPDKGIISMFPTAVDQLQGFTDDAGLQMDESYEEFPQEEKKKSLLNPTGIGKGLMSLLGFLFNPVGAAIGMVSRGIMSSLPKGRGLLSDFKSSATLKDFFQERRDRKAREDAARRGALKELQGRIDSGQFDGSGAEDNRDASKATVSGASKSKGVGVGGYTQQDSAREAARGRY